MRLLLLVLTLCLPACSLTPELAKPTLPVPSTFSGTIGSDIQMQASDLGWRTMFGDERLQRLIELALNNNRDLRLAVLNVKAVEAQYNIQRASRLPSVDITGSTTRQRLAPETNSTSSTPAAIQQQHGLNVGISNFEVDLFGRARALSDSAFARYMASDYSRRAAHISLVGAVADAYIAELIAKEQLNVAEQTLANWRQSFDLTRQLKAANQNSGLDEAQAEGQVASAEADLETRTLALAQAKNALQLLIGTQLPENLPPPRPLAEQSMMTILPEGLKSELLLRRPDIQQAEQNLISANAEIGAARAGFFPRLSLTTQFGYASPAIKNLFDNDKKVWSFAPQLTIPIFNAGRLRNELHLSELRKSSAIAEYERAIQIAFREVADGLAGQEIYDRQIKAQTRAVASAERRHEISSLRYRAGVENRLELLDSQRQLYTARQTLLDQQRNEFSNSVTIYKALGGGLEEKDLK